jgi:hypothetical protein
MLLINRVIISGIATLLVGACNRLADAPAQYSALQRGGLINEDFSQIDVETSRDRKKQFMRPRTSKVQSSSGVNPSATLEASIMARRSWKSQNIADLENVRPAIALDQTADRDITASVRSTKPPAR